MLGVHHLISSTRYTLAALLLLPFSASAQNPLQRLFTNVSTVPQTVQVFNVGQISHQAYLQFSNAPSHTCTAPLPTATLQYTFDQSVWTAFGSGFASDFGTGTINEYSGSGVFNGVRFTLTAFDTTNCRASAFYSGSGQGGLGSTSIQPLFTNVSTAPQIKPVINISQAGHAAYLQFANAPAKTCSVPNPVLALEYSMDGSTWTPFGGCSGNACFGTGVFNNIRVNLSSFDTTDCLATGYYTASPQPWSAIPAPGAASDSVTGASSLTSACVGDVPIVTTAGVLGCSNVTLQALWDKASWSLCVSGSCATGTDLTNRYVVTENVALKKCYLYAKTGPVGADLVVDVLRQPAGTSLFPVGIGIAGFTLPNGQISATTTMFGTPNLLEGDNLSVSILNVGSTTAGAGISLVCSFK